MSSQNTSEYQIISGQNITFSPCCNDFVLFHDGRIICTGCKCVIKEIATKENVILRYKSNTNSTKIIKPREDDSFMRLQMERLKRYANDETFELCDTKCPKCNSNSRYCRNHTGEIIYICSNTECRNIF